MKSFTRNMTLKTKLSRLALLAVAIIAVAAGIVIFGYSLFKNRLASSAIADQLKQNIHSQVEQLIPSFLVEEQASGRNLLLERFKQKESLSLVQITKARSELDTLLPGCPVSETKLSTCFDEENLKTATVAPIIEGPNHFGYLIKIKNNDSHFAGEHLLFLGAAILLVLLLTFLVLLSLLARVTSKEIPDSLSQLVSWIESVLQGNSSVQAPNLRFQELNDLGKKIAEIIESHEKSREQAVIGQIASGIMHDIKTPMQPIVTAMLLVGEQTPATTKRTLRLEQLYSVVAEKIPVIGEIIESTLDGCRKIQIESKPNSLNETIKTAIEVSAQVADLKRTSVEFVEQDGSVIAPHDPVQMIRVLSNLIKNGAEAQSTQPNGQIRVTLARQRDNQHLIRIEDAGPGFFIPSDKVFRAFRSTKARGTGLGLLISKKIVEAHGGQISVTSSLELKGAAFEISLPTEGVMA